MSSRRHEPQVIKPPPDIEEEDDFVPPSPETLRQLLGSKPPTNFSNNTGTTGDGTKQHVEPHKDDATSKAAAKTQEESKKATNSTSDLTTPVPGGSTIWLLFLLIVGNFAALKLTTMFGMSILWSSIVAGGLILAFYDQRKLDLAAAKWQANFEMLKSRTHQVLSEPNESAEWLNSALQSAWKATLPSMKQKAIDAFNSAIQSTKLTSPIRSMKCTDMDILDACPNVIRVASIYADRQTGIYPQTKKQQPIISTPANRRKQNESSILTGDQPVELFNLPRSDILDQQRNPPAVAMDVDFVANTKVSTVKLLCHFSFIPIEVQVLLHSIKVQASVRLFAEFNHALPFPHISRLSATFLEPPDVDFDMTMSRIIDLNKLPFMRRLFHCQISTFIIRHAMHPNWFDVISNPVSRLVALPHHIQYPDRSIYQQQIASLPEEAEPFRAASGLLLVDARVILRSTQVTSNMSPPQQMPTSTSQQPPPMQLNQQQFPNGDSWFIFQLSSRPTYEQIDINYNSRVSNQSQLFISKFGFLINNAQNESMKVEVWTKRGVQSVKIFQIVIKSSELFKQHPLTSGSPFTGPNRIELPISQWNCSLHLTATYHQLPPVPLLSFMPNKGEYLNMPNTDELLFNRRRLSKRPSDLQTQHGQTDNQLIIGGVLFIRLRNLNLHLDSSKKVPNKRRFVYALISVNGELLCCSPQHPIGEGDQVMPTVVGEAELILPPPVNPANNREITVSVDFMLNDSPVKAFHSPLGCISFNYKLQTHRADQSGQQTATNATSKHLQLGISKKSDKGATGEQPASSKSGEAGQVQVDIHFRPVNGLEEVKPIPQLSKINVKPIDPIHSKEQSGQDFRQEFLRLSVLGASDMKLRNLNSLGDLFAKVKFNGRQLLATNVQPSTLDPVWNECVSLPAMTDQDRLLVEIWDYDFVAKSNYVGHVLLTGDEVIANSVPVLPQILQKQNEQSPRQTFSSDHIDKLQQQQRQQCSIWLPLAESNGQVELLIVNMKPVQPFNRRLLLPQLNQPLLSQPEVNPPQFRYTGSRSSAGYVNSQANNRISPAVDRTEFFSSPQTRSDISEFSLENVAGSSISPPVLNRQSTFGAYGSNDNLIVPNQHGDSATAQRRDTLTKSYTVHPTYGSLSLDNLTNVPEAMHSLSPTQYAQVIQMQMASDPSLASEELNYALQQQVQQQQAQKGMLLEAALLSSSASSSVRVSLIVCLLEVRGDISALIRSKMTQLPQYISIKISKKNSAKTLQVFSTTLTKSRPLLIPEHHPDVNMQLPPVAANMTFQLQDMRLDGVIKVVVTPVDINVSTPISLVNNSGTSNIQSANRPILASGGVSDSSTAKSQIGTMTSRTTYAPVIDWSCDVRDLLVGGEQEFDPLSVQAQQIGSRPGGLPNTGISRRVRFDVAQPDVSFVFRITQVFRQVGNASNFSKPQNSGVAARSVRDSATRMSTSMISH